MLFNFIFVLIACIICDLGEERANLCDVVYL